MKKLIEEEEREWSNRIKRDERRRRKKGEY